MHKFIPREKMSKKARRALATKNRTTWDFSPVSRKVESGKRYNRKKNPRVRYGDSGAGFFSLQQIPLSETPQKAACMPRLQGCKSALAACEFSCFRGFFALCEQKAS